MPSRAGAIQHEEARGSIIGMLGRVGHLCHSQVASVGDRNSRMPWPKEASRYADCGGCVSGQYCPFCTSKNPG